jgi:hypothetical protein
MQNALKKDEKRGKQWLRFMGFKESASGGGIDIGVNNIVEERPFLTYSTVLVQQNVDSYFLLIFFSLWESTNL